MGEVEGRGVVGWVCLGAKMGGRLSQLRANADSDVTKAGAFFLFCRRV